jgi:hypothetical protein
MGGHTEGEWTADECWVYAWTPAGHMRIGATWHPEVVISWVGVDRAECMANARLIAAAPDLLEALEDVAGLAAEAMKAVSNQPFDPESLLSIRRARAAIAKAKGTA